MSYYPEAESHIRDKVKVVLDLSNYATKKKIMNFKKFVLRIVHVIISMT